jgi:hypothetical protein
MNPKRNPHIFIRIEANLPAIAVAQKASILRQIGKISFAKLPDTTLKTRNTENATNVIFRKVGLPR